MLSRTLERAANKSFQPSLSKSPTPLDHPDISRVGLPKPLRPVTSTKIPPPRLRNKGKVSSSVAVCQISGRPSLSRSRNSAPIPETVLPFSRSEEHTSELQSLRHLVCRLLL